MSDTPHTLNQALLAAMDRYGRQPCFRIKKDHRPYQEISYYKFQTQTFRLAHFFRRQGIEPGDRVAILAGNSPEWMMAYCACLLVGGVAVPLRPTLPIETLRSLIRDAEARLMVIEVEHHQPILQDALVTLPQLKDIVTLTDQRALFSETTSITAILAQPISTEEALNVRRLAEQIEPAALASLNYTASETGLLKAAVFNQGQRLLTMQYIAAWATFNDDELAFTVLPWASTSSLDFSLHCFMSGVANALAKPGQSVVENLQQTAPTTLMVTPLGLEVFYNEIMREIEALPEASQEVFHWALSIGKAYRMAGDNATEALRREYASADMTFFSQIRGKVGGRVNRLYYVGAALPQKLVDFMEAIGQVPLGLYSITETGGFPVINYLEQPRSGACGQIAPGFELRLAEDGEILVKSPTVMLTYWNQPQETVRQVLDADGWLHTGDLGEIDSDGYVHLNGRKQSMIILSSGRKIIPARIEAALKESPFVAQAIVFGEGRAHITALIVPNLDALADSFEDGLTGLVTPETDSLRWYWLGDDEHSEPIATMAHAGVKIKLDQVVEAVNRKLDLFERIEKYSLLEHAYSKIAHDMADLTPLQRRQIGERFATLISSMYPRTILQVGEQITQVEVSPERMRELLEKETLLDAWLADAGLEFLFDLARRKQIDTPSIVHICDTAASIAQMVNEERPLSTALIVGDPPRIARHLPVSQIQMLQMEHIRRMRKNLTTLAMMVDGKVLGYVIDKHGYVRGIHKLDDKLDNQANPLLGPQFRRHAAISGLCDALVFYVPSGGKQVRVFADGQLVGRYSNGDWSQDIMPQVDEVINQLAQQKNLKFALLQRLLRCAFQMSEENLGAIFIVGNADAVIEKSDAPEISHFAWIFGTDVRSLSDEELINFAKQDGATVIDAQGKFRGCMVLLRPDSGTKAEIGPGRGARHSSAAKMSAETDCLAITVSQDGPITVYDSGRRVLSL
ncbi:MAG TPA: AMP-binding protein [Anaerolineae bacterium]|nr:AMP-binding protein [Anaerolineae bacterium]HRV90973.1 AMP-binding protein [Anaerolineae bacterium]